MVLGVLFDRAEAEARALAQRLARSPFPVALNEPWSGRDGLMYAPERAARVTGGPPIEIEVRNDVATDPVLRPEVVRWVADALAALWPPATPRG
jgi:predicted N-formylglutamate amidohydrolase